MFKNLKMPRWSEVLVAIHRSPENQRYCGCLNRLIKGSITHLREIVRTLAHHNLVKIYSERKIKKITLTEKGQRVTINILNIRSELVHTPPKSA